MPLTDPGISERQHRKSGSLREQIPSPGNSTLEVSTPPPLGLEHSLGLQQHRMQLFYLQLSVVGVQLLHHVLGLAYAAAQLRGVLGRRQLAVVRLQDGPHPVTLLPGTTANFRDAAPD